MKLNPDQISQYHQHGFLLLTALIPQTQLQQYDTRFHDFVEGKIECPSGMKIMQDVMVVKGAVTAQSPLHGVNKILGLENDPQLNAYSSHTELVTAVSSLLGDELYSLTSNVFNKPPGVDGRHPMHQDLRYFRLRPADKILGAWTAILPARRESGCLAIIPGSHKWGLLEHQSPDWKYLNHGFYGVKGVDLEARQHIEMEPGDTLLFHPLLVHGSGRNRSAHFRRAISVHFAAGSREPPNTA